MKLLFLANAALLMAYALDFERPWNEYVRHLFGCPTTGETTADTCRPSQGVIDYRAWMAACERAKKVFPLTGDCAK